MWPFACIGTYMLEYSGARYRCTVGTKCDATDFVIDRLELVTPIHVVGPAETNPHGPMTHGVDEWIS